MTVKCAINTIPTKAELKVIFAGIDLPSLPTFPKPFFGDVNDPEMENDHWFQEFCQNAYAAVIGWIIDQLKVIGDLVGLGAPFLALKI